MVMVLPTTSSFSGVLPFLLALAEALNYVWHTHSTVSTEGNYEKYLMQEKPRKEAKLQRAISKCCSHTIPETKSFSKQNWGTMVSAIA